ncbi:eisosome protein 1 protein [Ophiocordyceps camponoti-floridani]|uniref:Eisosome protein 1 protein n=1 Tax=Ophiocordyceps camponoti-floridani TaxID=2030778 RepID=A0A8H4VCD0_9HYPO|nr:eisosome protein 1 protein [Ophiocordyceps camponoti-floridani]
MAAGAAPSATAPHKSQQLSTATAAGRSAYYNTPRKLTVTDTAIVAANQGWARSKSAEPPKPDGVSAASAAAQLAKNNKMPSESKPSAHPHGYQAASLAYDSAGVALRTKRETVLSPATLKRQTWGNSAATQALRNSRPLGSTSTSRADRSGSITTSRVRPTTTRYVTMRMSAPPTNMSTRYLHHGIDSSGAALGAAQAHRNSMLPKQPVSAMPAPSSELGCVIPYTTMDRSMFTSRPPVQPVLDARAKQEKLQQSALELANLMYDRQRVKAEEARAAADEPAQPNPYINLQYAAQRRAQERLSQLQDERIQNLEFRDYYYGQLLPPTNKKNKKSKSKSKSKSRRRSLSTGRVRDEVPPVPGQGPIFPTRMDQVDAEQRERDREVLLAAAQRNVKDRIRGMETKKSRKNKRKHSHANMTLWELQAQQALQAHTQDESERRDLVNLGGGRFMTPEEINAIASRRVQPILDDIDARAAAERERKAQAKEKRGRSRKRKSRRNRPINNSAIDEDGRQFTDGEDGEAAAENAEGHGEQADDDVHHDVTDHHAMVGSPVVQMEAERDGLVGHQVEGVEDHREEPHDTRWHHHEHEEVEEAEYDGHQQYGERQQVEEQQQHYHHHRLHGEQQQLDEQQQHYEDHQLHDEGQQVQEQQQQQQHDNGYRNVQDSGFRYQEEAVTVHEPLHAAQHQPQSGREHVENRVLPAGHLQQETGTITQPEHGQRQVQRSGHEAAGLDRSRLEEASGDEEDFEDVAHEKTREAAEPSQQHREHVAAADDGPEHATEDEDAARDYHGPEASTLDPHVDALPPRYTPELPPRRPVPDSSTTAPTKTGVRGWIRNRFSRRNSVSDHQPPRERRRSFFGGSRMNKMNQSATNLANDGFTETSDGARYEDAVEETRAEAAHGGSEAAQESTTAREAATTAREAVAEHSGETPSEQAGRGQRTAGDGAESIASTATEVQDGNSTFATPSSRPGGGNLRDSRFREMMDM